MRRAFHSLSKGTPGGAEVLRLDHLVGSIVLGKRADLVIFRCDDIITMPVHVPVATVDSHTSNANRHSDRQREDCEEGWLSCWSRLAVSAVCSGSKSERIKAQAAKVDLTAARAKWWEVFSRPL
ncbi:hypothetical protein N7449_001775 [Penicillium cf. viridicatum]|uniref:Amidohydrolase-related domain-containing protein n=1 Tax=Penicillium cf. viridicatum TaxID=2972119 RepID=A0A9W9N7F8_9EURO|nr:hypothetical protein N7449_001775 [Penicillium cf. viridicatum]